MGMAMGMIIQHTRTLRKLGVGTPRVGQTKVTRNGTHDLG